MGSGLYRGILAKVTFKGYHHGLSLLYLTFSDPFSNFEFCNVNMKLIIRSHEGPDAREKRPGLAG
ncbi:hypothetical protein RJ641_019868, partial [Dillenia turbinata]